MFLLYETLATVLQGLINSKEELLSLPVLFIYWYSRSNEKYAVNS